MEKTKYIFIRLFLIKVLIFSFDNLHGQDLKSAIKEFSTCVVYINTTVIKTEKINGQEYELWLKKQNSSEFPAPFTYPITGSGFLIADYVSLYLVTAQHVAKTTTLNTTVTIKDSLDNPITFRLRDFLKPNEGLNWIYHDTADVATLLLDPSSTGGTKSYFNYLPVEFIDRKLETPIREREVTVIGFPLQLGIGRKFSPISKTAKPSSGLIELPRFDNKIPTIFYLLDDPSVSGFSGAPVFELPANLIVDNEMIFVKTYRLMGLVHGTINDKTGGFAAIVPSFYIYESIEKSPKYTGVYTFYFPNGTLWSKIHCKNGMPWTVISNYDSWGKPVEMGTLKEGNGSLFVYEFNGTLTEIQYYDSGKLIRIEKKK